ncbi:MAG: FecR domain-containing protein [Bryobacteraceae bacterium]|nr:FecR domain-containing protein [Bryobacteraceae bacterium]
MAIVWAMCFWIVEPASAQPGTGVQARVVSLTGTLSVMRSRQPPHVLKVNDAVAQGDELVTGENSAALIRAADGSTVRIYPDSRVVYSEQSPDISEFLHLFFGSIKVHIERLSGRPNPQKLTTPTAVIAVRGTTFSVFVDDTDATLVAVDEGLVAVANVSAPTDEVLLGPGQRTWVRPGQRPALAQRFRGRSERVGLTAAARSRTSSASTMHSGTGMMRWSSGHQGTGSEH